MTYDNIKVTLLALMLVLGASFAGCDSDSDSDEADASVKDGEAADGASDSDSDTDTDSDTDSDGDTDAGEDGGDTPATMDPALEGIIGQPCTPPDGDEAGPGTCADLPDYRDDLDVFCFTWADNPDKGFCTATGCLTRYTNEEDEVDTCPGDGNICSDISIITSDTADDEEGYYVCTKLCDVLEKMEEISHTGEGNCPDGFACNPYTGVGTNHEMMPTCIISECTDDADCGLNTGKECNPQNEDADCDEAAGETCENTDSADDTIGKCYKPGTCYPSGVCGNAGGDKGIGAPCTMDEECPADGFCLDEFIDSASGKLIARNGYCTKGGCLAEESLDWLKCPAGSLCNRAYSSGGLCQLECDYEDPTGCRQTVWEGTVEDENGDYECYNMSKLAFEIDGERVPIADGNVCDIVYQFTCEMIADIPGMFGPSTCVIVGSTKSGFECRDLDGKSFEDDYSEPDTYCMDETTSGPTGGWD